jgi:CheY-like chemotaxis protein
VDEQPLILVVEYDEATRSFLLDNLAADGFRVAGASGAGEALRAIEVRQPALVVLDLALDDGSGLTFLGRVRAADGLSSRIDPDPPVIVLTGRSGDADRVRSFNRGADDHLNKPSCHFLPHLRAQFEVRASSTGERRSPARRTPRGIAAPSRGAERHAALLVLVREQRPWSASAETAGSPPGSSGRHGPGARPHAVPPRPRWRRDLRATLNRSWATY